MPCKCHPEFHLEDSSKGSRPRRKLHFGMMLSKLAFERLGIHVVGINAEVDL